MGFIKGAMLVLSTVSVMAATSSTALPSSTSTASTTSTQATAATTSTTAVGKSWYQKLKDSPFSMQYLAEGSNDFKKQINGYSFYNYLYLGYSINKTFAVKLVPYWSTDFTKAQENKDGSRTIHSEYGATQARLYVNKILTNDKHGFDLSLQNRIYYYPAKTRDSSGYDVKNRIYLIGGKKITDKFKIGTYAFYETYVRNSGTSTAMANHYVAVAPTYFINDKMYTALTVEYYRTKRKAGVGEGETISISPEVGYDFSFVSLSAALALEPIDFRADKLVKDSDRTLKDTQLIVSAFFPIF